MNTGIQDGYNLAWKLALVLNGKADQTLLQTYNQERLENAKHLLQTTDRMFEVAAGSNWLMAFLRTTVLPLIAPHLLKLNSVKHFVFPLLSQIGIHYRQSPLSHHRGDEGFNVKVGDRMPYFQVEGQSIYDKLRQPKFHLLTFLNTPIDAYVLKTELEHQNSKFIDFHLLPLDRQVATIFGTNQAFSVLLRPDNYIALLATAPSLHRVDHYLKELTQESLLRVHHHQALQA